MISDPKRVMLLGDTHGNAPWTVAAIEHAAENGADTIVQLGDWGHWTDGPERKLFYLRVHKALVKHGITLYWLDGNHEDHSDIQKRLAGSRDAQPLCRDYPRIIHLPRGCRWSWWGKTWMALGSAVSVDKNHRKEGKSWWPGETLKRDDVEYASRPGKVDVLLCHDAPFGVHIPGIKPKGQSEWPDWVLDESYDHQRLIRDVAEATRPSLIAHGHMHTRYQAFLPYGGGSRALVQGLDCDGAPMKYATLFINRPES